MDDAQERRILAGMGVGLECLCHALMFPQDDFLEVPFLSRFFVCDALSLRMLRMRKSKIHSREADLGDGIIPERQVARG